MESILYDFLVTGPGSLPMSHRRLVGLLQSATKFLRHCTQIVWGNFREQKNPHPSPVPFIQSWGGLLFSIGSSNSGTTLHGGDGEEKLYSPLIEVSKT